MKTNQMTGHKTNSGISRRTALKAALAAAAASLLQLSPGLAWPQAAAPARKATKVLDFVTGADVAKSEQEGEVVFYTHDSEPARAHDQARYQHADVQAARRGHTPRRTSKPRRLPPVGIMTMRGRMRTPATQQMIDCLRRAAKS
jgi:hypothetical protein